MLDYPLNSLGLPKAPADTRVVVAMSGGVDSSVVAAMLKDEGYDVIGVTLQLYDHGAALAKKGACCAGRDIHDARRVAETMGFPHYVLDYENTFREAVMEEFADAYLAGATPVPCIRCNERLKFKDLLATAKDLNADCMATGHYIQRKLGKGPELHRAADSVRDQSYFLFSTTPDQLDYLRFPLGHLGSKAETRALAAKYGLPVADKPDSQDICFVPNGNYAAVIEKLRPGAADPGDIVDLAGNILGQHNGIIHYTVGQRKGLPGGFAQPMFVVDIIASERAVVIGPREELLGRGLEARELNWLAEPPMVGARVQVQVRNRARAVPGIVVRLEQNSIELALEEAVTAITAGQSLVLFDGVHVLGGGVIERGMRGQTAADTPPPSPMRASLPILAA